MRVGSKSTKGILILLAVLMIVSLTACKTVVPQASPTPAPTQNLAVEATDTLGTVVKLSKPAQRIVSLMPANTEILFALGIGNRVVGVDAMSDYPTDAKAIAKVGDYQGINVEKIVGLKADLVLGGGAFHQGTADSLKKQGIPTAMVDPTSMAQVYVAIEMVGKLAGVSDKAQELIADMKEKQAIINISSVSSAKPTVYYVLSYGEFGDYTCGPGSFVYDMMEKAGGKPVTSDAGMAWPKYSLEKLLEKNPDVLILSSDLGVTVEAFKRTAGYKELKAVKENRVYIISANLTNRPGPRMIQGLEALAKVFHPNRFQ